jgi:hypothetical protein
MNDQQKKEPYSGVRDQQIRAALDQHWAASDANDFETEHRIYHEYAVLEYPQSGERTRGRRNMEFRDDKVARETQYFADPFVAPAWRAQWVERIDT